MSTPATISLHMQNSRGRILSMPVSGILLIEPFELEGTVKSHLVQLLYNEQGHLQLHQVLRALYSLIQSYLESLKATSVLVIDYCASFQ